MFKKPGIWILFGVIFLLCSIYTYFYFSHAFPIVNLDLKMDRAAALNQAAELTEKFQWEPTDFKTAAEFRVDSELQNFVELEAGGTEAFHKLLQSGLYAPYTWRVRHFKENETKETLIRFTPDGQRYGFVCKLPEKEAGASLKPDSARILAESTARQAWGIDFTPYQLVEKSQQVQPGGRVDHTLVYERSVEKIGAGQYRLRLVVGGDRLTELTHFVKIPEAFSRRFEEMRSANNTISITALIAAGLLFGLGGCVLGLFFLLRQRWVIWRQPLYWGIFIALLQVLVAINQWPLDWMSYDTALSTLGFWLRQITNLVLIFLAEVILLTVTFMAAETLTRKAFPEHLQFWRLWSKDVAGSKALLGRTVGGYLFVGLDLAFLVAIYFAATKWLGWWTPSEALIEPNILATYFPWLSSIAISLHAGFWEESMFRAIPIAGAALLGARFGRKKLWLIVAFLLQAIIFGGGHANYAQQPAYARMVELILPSLVWGGIYLYFGLLPAIILHFAIDVFWFSLPLFVSTAAGIWVDRVLVIVLTLMPLWLVLFYRFRNKAWREPAPETFNRAWQSPVDRAPETTVETVGTTPTPAGLTLNRWWLIAGVLGLAGWMVGTNFYNDAPPLTVNRRHAITRAQQALTEHQIQLAGPWETLAQVVTPRDEDDRFVWQTGGKEKYQVLMPRYLNPPEWKVRFAQFKGDVVARAEEYQVWIGKDTTVTRFRHQLPEAAPGDSLAETPAREIAHQVLRSKFHLEPTALQEVSAEPFKLPNRTDWRFTFSDSLNYSLKTGQARIVVAIAGRQVSDAYSFVYVPEDWSRAERDQQNVNTIVRILFNLIRFVIILSGVAGAIVSWSRKKFVPAIFWRFTLFIFVLYAIIFANSWPIVKAGLSTAEPLANQIFLVMALGILSTVFISVALALILGLTHYWLSQHSLPTEPGLPVAGYSVGFLLAGLFAGLIFLKPVDAPFWAEYDALSNYFPFLATAIDPISDYVMQTVLFLLVFGAAVHFSHGWTRRRGLIGGLLLLFGGITSGEVMLQHSGYWLVAAGLRGFIFLAAFLWIFRTRLSLIPLVFAVPVLLSNLRYGLIGAYPQVLPASMLALVLILGFSLYWHWELKRVPAGYQVISDAAGTNSSAPGSDPTDPGKRDWPREILN